MATATVNPGDGGLNEHLADGSDVSLGSKADAAYTSGDGTLISIAKGMFARLVKGQNTKANSLSVAIASDQVGTAGSSATDVLSVQGIASGTALPISGSITVTSAPTTAVTIANGSDVAEGSTTDAAVTGDNTGTISAKLRGLNKDIHSTLGTAGSSATVVVSVQGIASGTALPISGTVSVNALPVGSNVIGGVTIADGSAVTIGALADAAYTSGSGSVVAILKGMFGRLALGQTTKSASLPVVIASDQVGTAGTANANVLSVQGIASGTNLNVAVNAALPAGTNLIGKSGIDQTTPGTTNGVTITDGTHTVGVNADNGILVHPVSAIPTGTNTIGNVHITDGSNSALVNTDGGLDVHVTNYPATQGVSIADGADSNAGASTDGKITGDNPGSMSSKMRGLNTVMGAATDTTASNSVFGATLHTASLLAKGTQTTANSLSVGLASDQIGVANSPAGKVVTIQGINASNPLMTRNGAQRNGIANSTVWRSGLTTTDKLSIPSAPSVTGTTGGSLATSTNYNIAVAASNSYGTTNASSLATLATSTNTAARVAITQISHATSYEIFLSTDAAPLWVARITETQRAAGCVVTAVGTVSAGSVAGSVDIRVVGTGLPTTNATFTANAAFDFTGLTGIDCSNYSTLDLFLELSVSDFRSSPSVTVECFIKETNNGIWCAKQSNTITYGSHAPLSQDFVFTVNGNTQAMILVDTIAGQGASLTIAYDLY